MIIRNLSKRERMLGIIVALLGIVAVAYSLVAEPLYNRWVALRAATNSAEFRLRRNLSVIHRRSLIEYELSNLLGDYPESSETDSKSSREWLRDIESAAAGRLWLQSFAPGEPAKTGGFYLQSVEVECNGDLASAVDFFQQVLRSSSLTRIDALRIRAATQQSNEVACYAVITKVFTDAGP
ncbi:MAG: hypothetical protein ABIK83_06640 [Candidatus Zixiibacteriota bacterium]